MKKAKNEKSTSLLYIISSAALLLSILAIVLIYTNQTSEGFEWRCDFAECTEYAEISGEEWAQENCVITQQGTICLATFDDGTQSQIPLEELNLSAITATKCLNYVCTEETAYRPANYDLDLDELM